MPYLVDSVQYATLLEITYTATYPGFESLSLRHRSRLDTIALTNIFKSARCPKASYLPKNHRDRCSIGSVAPSDLARTRASCIVPALEV